MKWLELLRYAPDLVRLARELSDLHSGKPSAVRADIVDRTEEIRRLRAERDAELKAKHGG